MFSTASNGPPVGILRDKSTLNLHFHGNGNFDSDFAAIALVMEEFFFSYNGADR